MQGNSDSRRCSQPGTQPPASKLPSWGRALLHSTAAKIPKIQKSKLWGAPKIQKPKLWNRILWRPWTQRSLFSKVWFFVFFGFLELWIFGTLEVWFFGFLGMNCTFSFKGMGKSKKPKFQKSKHPTNPKNQ